MERDKLQLKKKREKQNDTAGTPELIKTMYNA